MKYQPLAFWITALIAGIWLQQELDFNTSWLWAGIVALCALLFICFLIPFLRKIFVLTGLILLIFTGALRFDQYNADVLQLTEFQDNHSLIKLKVKEKLKPSAKFNKYIAFIDESENPEVVGQQILVYVRKSQPILHVQDKCWTYASLHNIPEPKNPHQFDYQKYMLRKKVGLQMFTDTVAGILHPSEFHPAHEISVFKENIKTRLDAYGFSQESKIFISSLALGDRSDLNPDFQEKLSSAGVMHLFAISGLHVGIVFAFLMVLLYPILFLKNGKYIRIVLALAVIWFYAWFVGFTPSVTRAAFMISLYYTTVLLRRPTNIFHTLALSGFILLLINPNQLFDVGFQLSYSAVFFIAWLFPVVRRFFPYSRKPWRNYPYDLLTVTMVAQMGVMPISVFYFHTFSGVFLLGNMVLLPFAGILIVVSIVSVLLMTFEIMPAFLVEILNTSFVFIFDYLDGITSFKSLIFKGISWNFIQISLLLMMLVYLRFVLKNFRPYKLIPVLMLFLIFQMTRVYDRHSFGNKSELVVFQEYKGSMIGVRNGANLDVFMQTEDSAKSMEFTINPYVLNEKISMLNVFEMQDSAQSAVYVKKGNLLRFNDELYGFVHETMDSLPALDYAVLSRIKPEIKLNPGLKGIIADGSNYPNVIDKLRMRNDTVNIHATAENGAFLKTVE